MQKLDIGDQLIFRAPGRRHDHYDLAPLSGKIPSDHADLAMPSGVILDRSRIVSLRLDSYRCGDIGDRAAFELRNMRAENVLSIASIQKSRVPERPRNKKSRNDPNQNGDRKKQSPNRKNPPRCALLLPARLRGRLLLSLHPLSNG